MGWYIRKSWKLGPFRLNLSKSGLGWSVGRKGFRVGSGPRGDYVHAGMGGLYYRQSLSGGAKEPHSGDAVPAGVTPCTVCGEQNSIDAQFCIGCGECLEQASAPAGAAPTESTGPTPISGRMWKWALGVGALTMLSWWLFSFSPRVAAPTPPAFASSATSPEKQIRDAAAFRGLSDVQHLDAAEAILQRDPGQITAEQFSLAANHISAVTQKKVSRELKKRADKLAARLRGVAVLRNRGVKTR